MTTSAPSSTYNISSYKTDTLTPTSPSTHPETVAEGGLELDRSSHAPEFTGSSAWQDDKMYYEANPKKHSGTTSGHRILGLKPTVFWSLILLMVLILAAGLGVGLGVGLSKSNSKR